MGLSGSFLQQYHVRNEFAEHYGCSYNSLAVTKPVYEVSTYKGCMELAEKVATNHQMVFVEHRPDGSHKVHTGISTFGFDAKKCTSMPPAGVVFQESIKNPLLVQKRAFDVRSYMLVSSTLPFMVFFRRGFARRATSKYSSWTDTKEHVPGMYDGDATSLSQYLSLKKVGNYLATNKMTGAHFVDTFLQSAMKKIALFAFHAARRKMERRRGSYMLFSLDFLIDDEYHIYLEKTDPHPELFVNPSADHASMTTEMHDLLQELHEEPVAFSYMSKGDKYGKWELIFSELEETCSGIAYNPCSSYF